MKRIKNVRNFPPVLNWWLKVHGKFLSMLRNPKDPQKCLAFLGHKKFAFANFSVFLAHQECFAFLSVLKNHSSITGAIMPPVSDRWFLT